MLTTEHFTLQGARSATISDASSRASLYLGTLSGMLLALSLLGNATDLGRPFVIAAFVLAAMLIFLGVVTFVRVLESGLEDSLYARGINRIRHYYLEVAPEEQQCGAGLFVPKFRDRRVLTLGPPAQHLKALLDPDTVSGFRLSR